MTDAEARLMLRAVGFESEPSTELVRYLAAWHSEKPSSEVRGRRSRLPGAFQERAGSKKPDPTGRIRRAA